MAVLFYRHLQACHFSRFRGIMYLLDLLSHHSRAWVHRRMNLCILTHLSTFPFLFHFSYYFTNFLHILSPIYLFGCHSRLMYFWYVSFHWNWNHSKTTSFNYYHYSYFIFLHAFITFFFDQKLIYFMINFILFLFCRPTFYLSLLVGNKMLVAWIVSLRNQIGHLLLVPFSLFYLMVRLSPMPAI